jgi:hypothetical protein
MTVTGEITRNLNYGITGKLRLHYKYRYPFVSVDYWLGLLVSNGQVKGNP